MSSPPRPSNNAKPKPRQKTIWVPESDTAVDEVEGVDNEVAALEWEMEQEWLCVEAHVRQLVELKAKKVREVAERAEKECKAQEEAECKAHEEAE
jgi:hypothetical protein